MSTAKPAKRPRAAKSKADLEAKIAELEAKLNALATQSAKPAETKPTPPPPAPQPQVQQRPPPPPPQQQVQQRPPPTQTERAQTSTSAKPEVAPAYANLSSTGYTGNRYYATRQRLAYHPADKQFTGQVTVQVSRPAPSPAPEPEPQRAEPEPQKHKEEPRRIEPPAPTVKYTGANYYKTRQRLAYHPPDKQFIETVAIKFEDAPTAAKVESVSSQSSSQSSSSQKRSRAEELAAYEKEYLERVQQQKAEAEKPTPVPSTSKPHGTMPAGWKPS